MFLHRRTVFIRMGKETLLCIRALHVHHSIVISVQSSDRGLDLGGDLLIRQAETKGHHGIKNDIGMGGTGDHAEIVDGNVIVNAAYQRGDSLAGLLGNPVIGHHGVHMDDGVTAQLLPQFDFVEIFNACESAETNAKAKRLAEKFNKPGFGGSDAHRLDCIGKAYTELPDTIRSEDDLIAYVKTCPQIECGGEHYNGTTKDRIGRLNMVLVDSFYFYNKLANGWRWRKRRRELFDIIEKKL